LSRAIGLALRVLYVSRLFYCIAIQKLRPAGKTRYLGSIFVRFSLTSYHNSVEIAVALILVKRGALERSIGTSRSSQMC
jgi:hypothetical protein